MSAARSVAAPAWKSSSRPRCSSSRSSRWPRCSCIDQASPSRRVSTAGDRERTFSSRRAGVPRSLSTTVGKTSTGAENWNVRSIHRIVFMGDIIRAGAGPVQSRPMDDRREELLNVYDAKGAVVDARPRRAPGGGLRNVLYHVAVYAGRTDVPLESFRPQAEEIEALRYFPAAEVDGMLLRGELAPNMAYLWLTQGQALLALAGRPPSR